MKAACLLLFSFACWISGFAGGFQVNLQSIKATGMGHVGAALAIEPAVLFFNPGMATQGVSGISLGVNGIIARSAFLESAPGNYTAKTEPGVSTPFSFYANYILRGEGKVKTSFGLGVYTPFGSRVVYEDDWKGQFMIREINLRTFFLQPTFSASYEDKIGIGIGFIYAPGSVSLRKAIPAQFADGTYGDASLSGTGTGFGINMGMFYKPIRELSIGLSYRSAVGFNSENGDANFVVPADLEEFFPNTNFSANIKLPSTTSLGFTYDLKEKIRLAFDINYVGWSSYDTLGFDFVDNTDKLEDQASPREYANAFTFRLGGQYAVNDRLWLRAGMYLDMTPVQDGFITPETPDANKLGFSTGMTVKLARFLEADAAFLFVEGFRRSASNTEMNFSGNFKARAFIPAFGLNILFE